MQTILSIAKNNNFPRTPHRENEKANTKQNPKEQS
jgi:hypothetical protein